jgi:hypothetical protein
MPKGLNPQIDPDQSTIYQIRIKGHLDCQWADWFEGLTITLEDNGNTLLTGPVIDQAALHGILKKLRDLGLPLISVCPVNPGRSNQSNVNHYASYYTSSPLLGVTFFHLIFFLPLIGGLAPSGS